MPRDAVVVPALELNLTDTMAWRALCAEPRFVSPFFAPEFTQAIAQARPDVFVAVITHDGNPAFLPFQFAGPWQRRARAAERVGGHLSDFCGVIGPEGFAITPDLLLRAANLSALSFTHLAEDQEVFGLTGERTEMGLRANLEDGWQAYWTGRKAADKGFVADTERSIRKIAETLGPLRITWDDRDPAERTRVIDMKRAQYARTGVGDVFAEPWTRAAIDNLAALHTPSFSGLLSTLYAGDTWVASHFGLATPSVLHYWFPVYNPELARFSPGRLLLRMMLAAAADAGVATADFGAGDHPSKRKMATSAYRLYRGAWYRSNLRAFGFRVAQSLAWRLAPAPRPTHAPGS